MTDGWTLAPSGWRYMVRNGLMWADRGTENCVIVKPTPEAVVPKRDTELVRSLWEAKDGN